MNRRDFFRTAIGAAGVAALAKILPAAAPAVPDIVHGDIVCGNQVYSADMSTFKGFIRTPIHPTHAHNYKVLYFSPDDDA
jgi:hypothetical protein